ncbi:NAD(P)-binding protein [Trichodelitschia bisporula]|uniref:NAD(P)-binding protein n=1 Tax=Trichodelitschia bisporula TaxID=703511 RepID=A0A6G1HWX2_9PEZI|nr:NAD(P)-binding protein [Trichodelitschia bisporula]
MAENFPRQPLLAQIRQSPPLDLSLPYKTTSLPQKHILITGAASGLGASFATAWASAGASVVASDINEAAGTALVASLRSKTGNANVHFVPCDVTSWTDQVALFRRAVELSPHGGIDCVVANAGIAGKEPLQTAPPRVGDPNPPPPNLKVLKVNLDGVVYTTHLALAYLKANPGSAAPSDSTLEGPRDRHLLLVGSLASLAPIAGQPLYGAAKHGVLGLFRALRASAFMSGVRVNLLMPYFVATPIMPAAGRALLAGQPLAQIEDVVDAATRLVADHGIRGRGLAVGPRIRVVEEKAVWEAYADDFEDSEAFTRRVTGLMNKAVRYGVLGW